MARLDGLQAGQFEHTASTDLEDYYLLNILRDRKRDEVRETGNTSTSLTVTEIQWRSYPWTYRNQASMHFGEYFRIICLLSKETKMTVVFSLLVVRKRKADSGAIKVPHMDRNAAWQ